MAATKSRAKAAVRLGRPPAHEVESRNTKMLDAATEVFLEAGYTGAKMSLIAKRAGASMETLYARYPTKDALFAALIERKASGLLDVIGPLNPEREPLEALTSYARELVAMMSMPDTQKLHRLVIAGSIESPELGRLFWEAGPGRGFKIIATYLGQQKAMGKLAVNDVNRASGMLIGMLVGGIALRATLGMPAMIRTVQQQEEWANDMVLQFFRLFSPPEKRHASGRVPKSVGF